MEQQDKAQAVVDNLLESKRAITVQLSEVQGYAQGLQNSVVQRDDAINMMSDRNASLAAEITAAKQKATEDAQRVADLTSDRDGYRQKCIVAAAGPPMDLLHPIVKEVVKARCAEVLRATADRYSGQLAEAERVWQGRIHDMENTIEELQNMVNHNLAAMADGAVNLVDNSGPSVEEVHEADWSVPNLLDGWAKELGVELPPPVINLPPAASSSGNRAGGGQVPPSSSGNRAGGGQGPQPPSSNEKSPGDNGDGGSASAPPGGGPEEHHIASEGDEPQPDDPAATGAKISTAISHAKSYEKVVAPKFPSAANCFNWVIQLALNLTMAGGYVDQLEVPWLKEVLVKTFDELADGGSERMREADLALAKALQGLINGTTEPLKKDVSRKQTALFNLEGGKVIGGRQLAHMILNYFKTHRDLQRRHTWEDISTVKWKGDSQIYDTYCHWGMIVNAVPLEIDERER